jgi:hypothetical protein
LVLYFKSIAAQILAKDTWQWVVYIPGFSVNFFFQLIYADYAYFSLRIITLKSSVYKLSWNDLWSKMAAITISINFKWQKNRISWKFSMKFWSQIENQMIDYRLLDNL